MQVRMRRHSRLSLSHRLAWVVMETLEILTAPNARINQRPSAGGR
jgi:hypothetical protein